MLLAAHFQGFCRDLHTECVDHLLVMIAQPTPLRTLIRAEFTRGRQLDRGNAQPGSLGADFARLGIDLWARLDTFDSGAATWKMDLDLLNEWRNAIAHEDFTSRRLSGIITLRLALVRKWRASCRRLARSMERVMRGHMQFLTGTSPW